MTRDDFRRKWRAHVAGVIALGSAKGRKLYTGPIQSATEYGEVMTSLDDQADLLLCQLWDSMHAAQAPNGKPSLKVMPQ